MEISRHSVPDSMSVSKGKRDLAKGVHHFSFLEENDVHLLYDKITTTYYSE